VPSVPVPREKKKPVPAKDLDVVRAAIREWANAEKRNGPRSVDLPDLVEMLVATGMRIGELLALRWSDIELTPPPARRDDETWMPWLMVNGQITSKGQRVDYGKTDAAMRPIALPDWAAALLRRRKGLDKFVRSTDPGQYHRHRGALRQQPCPGHRRHPTATTSMRRCSTV
jgi:integrase